VNATDLTLVPSWRLGTLLRRRREQVGRTVDQVAGSSSRWTAGDLLAIEQGDRSLTDGDLLDVVGLYGVDPDELLPGRHELQVDLDQGELAAAGHTQPLAGTAPTADEVLASYLSLVYTLRASEPGSPLALRQADLDVLARALALATPDVEQRLRQLMADPAAEVAGRTSLLRARVLIPAAGILVAVCVGGALVVSSRSSSPSHHSNGSVRIGSAAVVTRNANGTPGAQHARTGDSSGGQPAVVTGNGITADQVPANGVGLAPSQSVTRSSGSQTTPAPATTDTTVAPTTSSIAD
jgi:Helix-turn-helix domain